jgi:hypothetical protein
MAVLAGCVSVAPVATPPPATADASLPAVATPAVPTAAATLAPSDVPTQTATQSPAEQPSDGAPTAPPPSPDSTTEPPATAAAGVVFSDDFTGTTKYLSSGAQEGFGSSEYVDGVFRITAEPREGFVNWSEGGSRIGCSGTDCAIPDMPHEEIDAAVVEVDATHIEGSLAAPFGISCSFQGTGTIGSFVGLTISADGRHYAVSHTHAPGPLPLSFVQGGALHGDVNSAISVGSGVTNHLRAECDGQRFALYVNEQPVAAGDFGETIADTEIGRGIALIAGAGPDGAVTVEFDNLVVSELAADVEVSPQQGTIFSDPLTTDSGWWTTGDLGFLTAEFTGSAYRLTVPDADSGGWLSPNGWVLPANVSVGVDATFVEGPDVSYFQLSCRNDQTSFYRFGVGADGAFALHVVEDGTQTPIVDWDAPSDAANVGVGATNSASLDCNDELLTGLINEQVVASEADATLTQPGVGLGAVSAQEEGGTVYDFTNFFVGYPETL